MLSLCWKCLPFSVVINLGQIYQYQLLVNTWKYRYYTAAIPKYIIIIEPDLNLGHQQLRYQKENQSWLIVSNYHTSATLLIQNSSFKAATLYQTLTYLQMQGNVFANIVEEHIWLQREYPGALTITCFLLHVTRTLCQFHCFRHLHVSVHIRTMYADLNDLVHAQNSFTHNSQTFIHLFVNQINP